ncbi:MAG: DNA adenine methylase [Moorellales bacterium]
MEKLRSPIMWYGGKGMMVKKLLPLIPPHKIYVEVFGGGASLLFAKEPSEVEVYNDVDGGLVNFFRVLRDPEKFARFYHLVAFTPYSREEFNFCRKTWRDCEDEVERAYRWFVVARMSFSGAFARSWAFGVTCSHRGMSGAVSRWLSTLEMLPAIHERLMRVQIENQDFRELMPTYDTDDTFFYLDPPYVPDTRQEMGVYPCEMGLDDHREMVDLILGLKGAVMLSGYRHEVYLPLEEAGWERLDFETSCHAVGRTRITGIKGEGSATEAAPRVESVWLNPRCLERRNKQVTIFDVAGDGS